MSIDRATQLKALHLFGMAAAGRKWQAEYALHQKGQLKQNNLTT